MGTAWVPIGWNRSINLSHNCSIFMISVRLTRHDYGLAQREDMTKKLGEKNVMFERNILLQNTENRAVRVRYGVFSIKSLGQVIPYNTMHLDQQWIQVMAWCHYLNQCWLIISEVLWNSPQGNFTGNVQDLCLWYESLLWLMQYHILFRKIWVIKFPMSQQPPNPI